MEVRRGASLAGGGRLGGAIDTGGGDVGSVMPVVGCVGAAAGVTSGGDADAGLGGAIGCCASAAAQRLRASASASAGSSPEPYTERACFQVWPRVLRGVPGHKE